MGNIYYEMKIGVAQFVIPDYFQNEYCLKQVDRYWKFLSKYLFLHLLIFVVVL